MPAPDVLHVTALLLTKNFSDFQECAIDNIRQKMHYATCLYDRNARSWHRCIPLRRGKGKEGERERAKPMINRNSHTIVEIYEHVLLAGGMRLLSEERRYPRSFVRLEIRTTARDHST